MSNTNGFRLDTRSENDGSIDDVDRATSSRNVVTPQNNREIKKSDNRDGKTIALGRSTFDSLALDVSYSPSLAIRPGTASSSYSHSSPLVNKKLSSIWEIPDFEENFDDLSLSSSRDIRETTKERRKQDYDEELWEDVGVVDYIERKLGCPDESTPEEREDALREVLADTDIHEGDGDLSDFLFHVARTKYGKIYIRVIRTLLLNRGIKFFHLFIHSIDLHARIN